MSIPTIQPYVLGFLFNEAKTHVLLIEKTKPDWQAGKLNGIGGKMEINETAGQAMSREMEEETGIKITDWKYVCNMWGYNGMDKWVVYVFTQYSNQIYNFWKRKDETPKLVERKGLPRNCLYNLNWLIPMCLDEEVLEKRIDLSVNNIIH